MDKNSTETLIQLVSRFFGANYDYLWLKTVLDKGRTTDVPGSTLITGSSYALNGIQGNAWKNAVNCSMHSQDLYYDFLCARQVISPTNDFCFERCFIIMGYYVAFQDLSLSKVTRESFISRIYYPVFHDAHNWDNPVQIDLWGGLRNISEQEKRVFENEAANQMKGVVEKGTYYTDFRPRFLYRVNGEEVPQGWPQMSDQVRRTMGAEHAEKHNRIFQHKVSQEENKKIFQEYVRFLHSHNVNPIVVIPPFTEEYSQWIRKGMKEGMLELLDSVPEEVHYVDFNDAAGLFGIEDFCDADHLSASGAEKMSAILVDMFGQ